MGTLDFFRKRTEKNLGTLRETPRKPLRPPPQAIDDTGSLILMQGP